jgi:putative hydrolase of HD superfamily
MDASAAIDFFEHVGKLKNAVRAGWVLRDVQRPESVADHSYRMAMMTQLLHTEPGIDASRCVQIALVHDLAEALVGDITPFDNIPPDEKHRREREALETIVQSLRGHPSAALIQAAYLEYEAAATPEARMVKDLDKLDMVLQALEYERQQPAVDLAGFFDGVRGKFMSSLVKGWAEEIESRRRQLWATRPGKSDPATAVPEFDSRQLPCCEKHSDPEQRVVHEAWPPLCSGLAFGAFVVGGMVGVGLTLAVAATMRRAAR